MAEAGELASDQRVWVVEPSRFAAFCEMSLDSGMRTIRSKESTTTSSNAAVAPYEDLEAFRNSAVLSEIASLIQVCQFLAWLASHEAVNWQLTNDCGKSNFRFSN